jgi:hypothetical protein
MTMMSRPMLGMDMRPGLLGRPLAVMAGLRRPRG